MAKRPPVSNEPVYTIGIAARKLGVSVHALRLYEREGLIRPFRTETNRRLYSDVEIHKVEWIKQMIREMGLNFEGLRRLIALVPCHKHRKDCSKEVRAVCPAHNSKDAPCWAHETECSATDGGNACRSCPVYLGLLEYNDIQRLIFGHA
jgi:MerR family transcriptional regulator, heat shock protein HspR